MKSPIARLQPVGDTSQLPTVTFGDRSLMWWGTLGFMVIEGWTLALLAGVYLYLRQHNQSWPPLGTAPPSITASIINVVLMALSVYPSLAAVQAAKRIQRARIGFWLIISSVLGILILAVRWREMTALNTRWDANAYGSAVWILVGFHASLLLVDVADTLVLTAFFLFKELPVKALSDVNDNTDYWFFTIGGWIPIFLLVYVLPYFLTGK